MHGRVSNQFTRQVDLVHEAPDTSIWNLLCFGAPVHRRRLPHRTAKSSFEHVSINSCFKLWKIYINSGVSYHDGSCKRQRLPGLLYAPSYLPHCRSIYTRTSFSIMAIFLPWLPLNIELIRVVLPLPRKPAQKVTWYICDVARQTWLKTLHTCNNSNRKLHFGIILYLDYKYMHICNLQALIRKNKFLGISPQTYYGVCILKPHMSGKQLPDMPKYIEQNFLS